MIISIINNKSHCYHCFISQTIRTPNYNRGSAVTLIRLASHPSKHTATHRINNLPTLQKSIKTWLGKVTKRSLLLSETLSNFKQLWYDIIILYPQSLSELRQIFVNVAGEIFLVCRVTFKPHRRFPPNKVTIFNEDIRSKLTS